MREATFGSVFRVKFIMERFLRPPWDHSVALMHENAVHYNQLCLTIRGAQLVGTNSAVFFPVDTTVRVMQLRFVFHQKPNESSFYRSGLFFFNYYYF